MASFAFDVPVEVFQVNAHTDVVNSFLGCHYDGSAGYDVGVIMPCSSKLWSSVYGIVLGVLMQNGFASSRRAM